ncbi:glycoside hydrolase family 47 protein [Polychaeton citri CBS 116435]|uniref:alpha-1,2-Mannosidase n=1 Tax=Polychaeton citri CBS 116435 TaxID=1314669 RepID=A0A9P4UKP7_9PEZI|nr:glycoside hydrolase family 47 protein [Polychaeton citri CBS 116435]
MHLLQWPLPLPALLLAGTVVHITGAMLHDQIHALKQETRDLFYHGFDNYMLHAFPEDELRPISCKPQTRNKDNPADVGLNDVLGNYSLTLIDSLSTLAILASDQEVRDGRNALSDFQESIKSLIELYGDGTRNSEGLVACGQRACGFDLDSKVQVFETNIRGVGGLLSAHLFAVGELPIEGYTPEWIELSKSRTNITGETHGIQWQTSSPFIYDGHLLRLAYDLALRLLPAFNTPTGLPYPRVNLRYGIPFYQDGESGFCRLDGTSTNPREITETCAAGAGSLVLEFATLSRLSGDARFERLAKQAFWSVWERRSGIGLVGNGIDAESGAWTLPPLAGIGAGIDSFFEYAVKSHILLQGLPYNPDGKDQDAPHAFLEVWHSAHSAVRRHIYRRTTSEKFPYYGQADFSSGAPRYGWIDNLSAYWPGLLSLVGELEEAIESHLLFAALWTHYSALPERWHAINAWIDPNFRHWAGRPEFIESTWYLYRATKDPWYLHVGEMVIRDIKRRCWTACGWADLNDVVSGDMRDRMESFFLGETAKYLFLLFDERHPLNHMDDAVVFTTEGHPLRIPKSFRRQHTHSAAEALKQSDTLKTAPKPQMPMQRDKCPAPHTPLPLTISNIANRSDFFHAAAMTQLHLVPVNPARPSPLLERSSQHAGISYADIRSPMNYTWYPWPLSHQLIPAEGFSAVIPIPIISTLTFPNFVQQAPSGAEGSFGQGQNPMAKIAKDLIPLNALQKTWDGILINSLSNVRLNMVREPRSLLLPDEAGILVEKDVGVEYRVHGIGSWALGRDEKIWVGEGAVKGLRLEGLPGEEEAPLRRVKDREWVDLVVEIVEDDDQSQLRDETSGEGDIWDELKGMLSSLFRGSDYLNAVNEDLNTVDGDQVIDHMRSRNRKTTKKLTRALIPAILPTGPGAAPLPTAIDMHQELLSSLLISSSAHHTHRPPSSLPYLKIFYLDSTLCPPRLLPTHIARDYNVLIIKRGGCTFSDKLTSIPFFPPSSQSLQLVIVRDIEWTEEEEKVREESDLIKPLLDKEQKSFNGVDRRVGIPVVMVDGRAEVRRMLRCAAGQGNTGHFDENGEVMVLSEVGQGGGLGVKRRYWFESLGIVVGNLLMA